MKEKRYTALMSDASAEASRQDERNPQEVKKERKQSRLAKASFAWTVISVLYAIVSGVLLVGNNWILAPYSYIMAGLLGVYVVFFVVLIAFYADDVKKGRKKIKVFKKMLGMFRIFTTLVFLVATAVSMAGVVDAKGTGLIQWIVLGANIAVAAVQLSLKLSLFIIGVTAKRLGRKYTVRVQTYVNGVGKDNKTRSKMMSKLYGTEVTRDSELPPASSAGEVPAAPDGKKQAPSEKPKAGRIKLEKEQMRELAAKAAEKLSAGRGKDADGEKGSKDE